MKIVKDCIHRFIEISPECLLIIDTPEFQRLRRIKQLGYCHYVYPSAVHTRFEHSLGVMNLAGMMFDQLTRTSLGHAPRRWRILLQIAGLMHDVGHVAFSHLFDEVQKNRGARGRHEGRSVAILRRVNARLGVLDAEEEDIVADMIMGVIRPGYPKYLFQIICDAGAGIDVDRMDYLQRDAYHTGIPGFQPDYIVKCAYLDEAGGVAFHPKARGDIRDLLLTRVRMFTNVYCHKTVLKFDRIMICCLLELPAITDDPESYLHLDDAYVESYLRHQLRHPVMAAIDARDLTHECARCLRIEPPAAAEYTDEALDKVNFGG